MSGEAIVGDQQQLLTDNLRQELFKDQQRYAQLSTTLGPNQPELRAEADAAASLRTEIQAVKRRELETARAREREAGRTAATLDAALVLQRRQTLTVLEAEKNNAALEMELATNLTLSGNMRTRLQTLRIEEPLSELTAEVIDPGVRPAQPVPRQLGIAGVAGGTIGGVIALCIIFVRLLRSTSMWTMEELENGARRRVFAVLPQLRIAPGKSSDVERRHTLEEDLQPLEQFMSFLNHDRDVRVVLFTSSVPGEGKSTVTATMAALMARAGHRVLVMDADLHRPTLHQAFNLPQSPGLSSLLAGTQPFEDALQSPPELPGLHVLTAGPTPPIPAVLLLSVRMTELMEWAAGTYDYVLLDTPPILSVADGVSLASMVDGVFLVARYGKVSLGLASRSCALLTRARTPLYGFVVNGAPG